MLGHFHTEQPVHIFLNQIDFKAGLLKCRTQSHSVAHSHVHVLVLYSQFCYIARILFDLVQAL